MPDSHGRRRGASGRSKLYEKHVVGRSVGRARRVADTRRQVDKRLPDDEVVRSAILPSGLSLRPCLTRRAAILGYNGRVATKQTGRHGYRCPDIPPPRTGAPRKLRSTWPIVAHQFWKWSAVVNYIRSANRQHLTVPRYRLNAFRRRAFSDRRSNFVQLYRIVSAIQH